MPYQDSLPCYQTRPGFVPAQTAATASYVVKRELKSYNVANEIPFDRNWGRSTNQFPLFTGAGLQPQFVQDSETPAIPFAFARPTDYQYLPYDPPSDAYGTAPAPFFQAPNRAGNP